MTKTLSSVVARKNDFFARYGGEKLVILMTTSDQNAVESIGIITIKASPNIETAKDQLTLKKA